MNWDQKGKRAKGKGKSSRFQGSRVSRSRFLVQSSVFKVSRSMFICQGSKQLTPFFYDNLIALDSDLNYSIFKKILFNISDRIPWYGIIYNLGLVFTN